MLHITSEMKTVTYKFEIFSFRLSFNGSLCLSIIINMQIGKKSPRNSDHDLCYLSHFPVETMEFVVMKKLTYVEAGKRN